MTMPYSIKIGHRLEKDQMEEISSLIAETFEEIDKIFNNWNPASEIAQINALPQGEYSLSPPLQDMLEFCNEMVTLSKGRFDPTIEPLCLLFRASSPKEFVAEKIKESIGWHLLHVKKGSLEKRNPDTKLDLCSLSKGLCVDWLIERLRDRGFSNLFVEWAGEIRGNGTHPSGRKWSVQIDPGIVSTTSLSPIPLHNAAIATSGTGQLLDSFHIIDPIKKEPMEKNPSSIAAVTVIAPSCMLADALATATMAMPTQKEACIWAGEIESIYPDVQFWIFSYEESAHSLF